MKSLKIFVAATLMITILSGCSLIAPSDYSQSTVTVTYDKFTGDTTIRGEDAYKDDNIFDDSTMLRAWVDKNGKIDGLQVYAVLVNSDWTFPKFAIDSDGKRYDITKIDSDVSCETYGCIHKEYVGVSISYDYLKSHKQGFEISFRGTYQTNVEVRDVQVLQMLESLDIYKKQ